MINPVLSIVICTHRRFDLLKLAVESLCCQTADKDTFHVIVVDNDLVSNSEVIKIVEDAGSLINIVYIHDSILGLSQARNTGGKAAQTEYIGYMDDDAKAPKHYIESALQIISENKPNILGGPYFPYYLSPKPKWFKDSYGTGYVYNKLGSLSENEFFCGSNMIYRKEILNLGGWFNREYGMTGNTIAYGEETALQIHLKKIKKDLITYYDKNLFVYHFVPENKMKVADRIKRSYGYGQSQAYLWVKPDELKKIKKKSLLILIRLLGVLFFKDPILFLFRDRNKYPFWQNYFFEVQAGKISKISTMSKYFKDYVRGK